jgi:surface protein
MCVQCGRSNSSAKGEEILPAQYSESLHFKLWWGIRPNLREVLNMLSVEVCSLPATGGSTFVVVAGLFLLIAGVLVTRWARASAGRMSAVVAPLALLGGLAFTPSLTDPCATTTAAPATTVAAPTTTVFVGDPNLVLEIDTTTLAPLENDSVSATDEDIIFDLGLFGDVNVRVNWGDGTSDDVSVAGPFPHTYATPGKYTITVSGSLTGFGQSFDDYGNPLQGAQYLTAVRSFGNLGIASLSFAFETAVNLLEVPSSLPASVTDLYATFIGASSFNQSLSSWDTSNVTNMSTTFLGASSFNQSLSSWDTSNVTDMSGMFEEASSFNQSLSSWDTSNVTDMSGMFLGASSFNQSLSSWDTSNVTDMNRMFHVASVFNQSLSSWDTSNVTDMSWMFAYAFAFNSDISGWDTSNVTDMSWMFGLASSFNQNLNSWVTSNVTDMSSMFGRASSFNQSLSSWDTSNVTDMSGMFSIAPLFNQSLSTWDTSNVTDMTSMFSSASSFNQSLSSWDTSNVTNMISMFSSASSFNQSLSSWDTSKVTTMATMFFAATVFNQSLGEWDISAVANMNNMLERSGLSVANYDATLNGWGALEQVRQTNVNLDAGSLQSSALSSAARSRLTNPSGSNWTIVDGGQNA